jgi:hypothetical protein
MSIQIDPRTLAVQVTTPRQTPPPLSRRFAEVLREGAAVVVSGVTAAAGALPGAPLVSAALRGATERATGPAAATDGAGSAPGGSAETDMERVMQESQAFNLYYLEIQEDMSRENRRFSALSNVMKARHETAKSAISNIR